MNTTNLQLIIAVLLLIAFLLQLYIIGKPKSHNISIGANSLMETTTRTNSIQFGLHSTKLNDETFRKAKHPVDCISDMECENIPTGSKERAIGYAAGYTNSAISSVKCCSCGRELNISELPNHPTAIECQDCYDKHH